MSETRQLFMRRPNLDDLPPIPDLPVDHDLRAARPEDDVAIAALLASAFEPDWSVERVQRALLAAADVETTFVVTAGGAPVATASARLLPERYPGSGYVHWVGAHADHRGKRLGRAVTVAVLHRFRELGCRDAVLETDPPRLPAIRLYLSLGFRPEPLVPDDAMIWREILAELNAARSHATDKTDG